MNAIVYRDLVIIVLAVVFGCSDGKKSSAESAASSAPRPAEKVEKAQEPTRRTLTQLTRGFAKFKGDALVKCAQATVMFDAKLKPTGLTAEELVILFAEDALMAAEGEEETALGAAEDKTQFTSTFRKMMFENAPDQQKAVEQVRTGLQEGLKPENLKKLALVRVDACDFPNRVPLGLCLVGDASTDFGWSTEVLHYDVGSTNDSDAGMKNCLMMGGKWTAANGRDAARERAKQHALELNKKLQKHSQQLNTQLEELKSLAND